MQGCVCVHILKGCFHFPPLPSYSVNCLTCTQGRGALIPSPPDPTPLHRADQATKQGSTVKGVASGVCQTWIKIPTPLLTKRAALGNVLDLLASGSPSGKGHGTH